ncbi:hypothetical protein [Flexivirga caeni]|uniref:Uncharacterized protein n=1 Tax=Flexivirga caeni TaxID=2294115 RepID=A0A3M9MHV0_9MICO|nr:hypothetical protein [Flexivirga caeni]RNI25111.1 hypothetical protein EFY87_00180 [Flexivirga caeni]
MVGGDFSGAGGLSGAAVCAALGTVGLTMRRTPGSAQRAELLAARNRALRAASARLLDGSRTLGEPSWLRVPVDRSVTYRESMSQVPWRLLAGCVLAGVVIVWGTTRFGWALWLLLPFVIVIVVVFAIALFAPYGIRLAGGTLTIGAFVVPRAGRAWKRQEIPLDEVLVWTVCHRPRRRRIPVPRSPYPDGDIPVPQLGKGVGNWGNFTGPEVANILVVRVDPARVPAAMPGAAIVGYSVRAASQVFGDTGTYIIGTHRGDRLAQTLERAMPSRRTPLT